jgi:hypothetical protein
MNTSQNDNPPRPLSADESSFWREAYADKFVDTDCEQYRQYIASQGNGLLWESIRSGFRITIQRFLAELAAKSEVLVMADYNRPITCFHSSSLMESLASLPDDIYVFDSSLSWTLVRTHESTAKRQICWAIGIVK